MKKLKFMLAAATAIGLASALQADDPQLAGSTDFEGYEIGVVTAATDSAYFQLPKSAEEGDYQIVAGNPNITRPNNLPSWFANTTPAKVLQLEGGTDPLERYAKTGGGLVDLTVASVYVDTLVQFTVTPAGDTVVPSNGVDKLMIYLKEDLENGKTNLVVKGGYFAENASDVVAKDYTLNAGKDIKPGTWYRLTVRAMANLADPAEATFAGFTVSIDGTVCTLDDYAVAQAEEPDEGENGLVYPFNTLSFDSESYKLLAGKKAVLSLVKNGTTLKSVGFAGSGLVDDLVITTLDPEETFLSFTLAFDSTAPDGAYGTAVSYTCGGLSGDVDAASSGGTTIWFASGNDNDIVVKYTASAAYNYTWTKSDGVSVVQNAGTDTITPVNGGSATLSASPAVTSISFTFTGANVTGVAYTIGSGSEVVTNMGGSVAANEVLHVRGVVCAPWYIVASESAVKADVNLTVTSANHEFEVTADSTADGTVPSGTTLAAVGVDATATGLDDNEQTVGKVAKWSTTFAEGSVATVNEMRFDTTTGEATNLTAEAYLLNTNATAEAVAQAKADFKFTSFDPTITPTADDFASKGYNGNVTIQGKAALSDADWNNLSGSFTPHFFRAILTK